MADPGESKGLLSGTNSIEETKERGKWYKDKNDISNLPSVLTRIKADSSGPCGTSNWISMPTAKDLIANAFKAPVFFWSTSYSQTFFPHCQSTISTGDNFT
ncbi:hypothetical protein VP01_1498g2 [Puccinia sorghi]|uniref:Uncharacterized protein n=1 Tax=Puccinia sorghi TaxID=27349 RepID=A0A0L6VJ51_9BASI|nr:hypothetical protein VP01_1498g2 [Puccinia sorghi]